MRAFESPLFRAFLGFVSLAAWAAFATLLIWLVRDGWDWALALATVVAFDVAAETGYAAWRGHPPDASLLFYLF